MYLCFAVFAVSLVTDKVSDLFHAYCHVCVGFTVLYLSEEDVEIHDDDDD